MGEDQQDRSIRDDVPMDLKQAWDLAFLWWQSHIWSTFVGAHADDANRSREARELCDRLISTDALDLVEAEQIAATLVGWADELTDHVAPPVEPRPAEMDRQVRDYVKDVIRDRLPFDLRRWAQNMTLSLDVAYYAAIRRHALTPQIREDISYVYGRGTMALDLGDRAAAERELARLNTYRSTPTGR